MPRPPDPTSAHAPAKPESLRDLFWSFTFLALQGFGGVLAVVQRELVERKRWLTRDEFIEDWAVAQILPGPNVVNLSLMLGARHFGFAGAMVSLAGILAFPLLIVLAMAVLFAEVASNPWAQGALRGMAAVAAGLIVATGFKLVAALRNNVMGSLACGLLAVATFVGVAWLRIPLAWVLLALGSLGCGWAWWRLRALQRLTQRSRSNP